MGSGRGRGRTRAGWDAARDILQCRDGCIEVGVQGSDHQLEGECVKLHNRVALRAAGRASRCRAGRCRHTAPFPRRPCCLPKGPAYSTHSPSTPLSLPQLALPLAPCSRYPPLQAAQELGDAVLHMLHAVSSDVQRLTHYRARQPVRSEVAARQCPAPVPAPSSQLRRATTAHLACGGVYSVRRGALAHTARGWGRASRALRVGRCAWRMSRLRVSGLKRCRKSPGTPSSLCIIICQAHLHGDSPDAKRHCQGQHSYQRAPAGSLLVQQCHGFQAALGPLIYATRPARYCAPHSSAGADETSWASRQGGMGVQPLDDYNAYPRAPTPTAHCARLLATRRTLVWRRRA